MKPEKEIEKNLLTDSRARLYVSLMAFCKEAGNHDPCLNYKECSECPVTRRLEELVDEVTWRP